MSRVEEDRFAGTRRLGGQQAGARRRWLSGKLDWHIGLALNKPSLASESG